MSTGWRTTTTWPAGCSTIPAGWTSRSRARPAALAAFLRTCGRQAPPLARIEGIAAADVPAAGYAGFEIRHSRVAAGPLPAHLAADIATCPDCLRELLDPGRPPLPLPLHQLHQLRPALHHHRRHPLRPPAHHHGAPSPCARPASASTTTRSTAASTPSPTPARSAGRTLAAAPGRDAGHGVAPATGATRRWHARGGRACCARGDPGGQGPGRISPGLRCHERRAVRPLRAAQAPPGQALRRHVADLDEVRAALRRVAEASERCWPRPQCPIVLLRWRARSRARRRARWRPATATWA